jgi:hypothetical protein
MEITECIDSRKVADLRVEGMDFGGLSDQTGRGIVK